MVTKGTKTIHLKKKRSNNLEYDLIHLNFDTPFLFFFSLSHKHTKEPIQSEYLFHEAWFGYMELSISYGNLKRNIIFFLNKTKQN